MHFLLQNYNEVMKYANFYLDISFSNLMYRCAHSAP